ncbi:hypothetical protein B9Z55_012906 [Caenorhabditis nigoni]|uniref:F-box domain-containing protein n=1 Tax=Caenorhabditis nigoni TaxID=1611254 RepID=A0A2G5TZE5_9PELO|nr:hypothetical protein B9Z55_012906 [Caenorhabditis nigoni]
MASTLENLTKMVENLSIDPFYETNWRDMPEEIKLECIKKMGIEERLSMRCTAKAEKSLVDSQKFKFEWGYFDKQRIQLNLLWRGGSHFRQTFKNSNEAVKMTNHIFKIGDFEGISVDYRDDDVMNFTEEISAKCIDFESCENKTVVDALRNLKNGVEIIRISAKAGINDYAFDEILAISHVQSVPYWHIEDCYQADSLQKVAQMWIDVNSKIGTTFQVSRTYQGPRPSEFQRIYLEHFTDHIVSNTGKRIRIRTNNPDRHILLERGFDYNDMRIMMDREDVPEDRDDREHREDGDDEMEGYDDQFFRLMVISAEMKESEYDNNCYKWIGNIDIDYAHFESRNNEEPNIYVIENPENIQNGDHIENRRIIENREGNPDDEDDEEW